MKFRIAFLILSLFSGISSGLANETNEPPIWISIVPDGKLSLLSLTFDDGTISHLTKVAPILKKYGIRASFYVIGASVGNTNDAYLTWAQIRELRDQGHEIGGHTVNHVDLWKLYRDGQTDEDHTTGSFAKATATITAEIVGMKKLAADNGIEIKTFAYPYNYDNDYIKKVTRDNGMIPVIPRLGYGSSTFAKKHQEALTKILRPRQFTVIMFQGVDRNLEGRDPLNSLRLFERMIADFKRHEDTVAILPYYEAVTYALRAERTSIVLVASEGKRTTYKLVLKDDWGSFPGKVTVTVENPEKFVGVEVNGKPVAKDQEVEAGVYNFNTGDTITLIEK